MSKEQENLRQKFKNETKCKLWVEDFTQEVGFSDAYVYWLEKQLLLYNAVGRSEQLKAFTEFCQDNYSLEIPDRIIKDYEKSH